MTRLHITRPRTDLEYKLPYNPSNIFARTRLVKPRLTEHVPAKTEEYPSNIPQFVCREKYLKDNKHSSLHLALKNLLKYLSLDIICSSIFTVRFFSWNR